VAGYQGCPFAAETMRTCEQGLERFRRETSELHESIVVTNSGCLLGLEEHSMKKIDLRGLCKMAVIYANSVCVVGEIYKELYLAVNSGAISHKKADIDRKRLRNIALSVKCLPYGYVDQGFSGFGAKGSQEWDISVKALKREPVDIPYDPKYFMVREKRRVANE